MIFAQQSQSGDYFDQEDSPGRGCFARSRGIQTHTLELVGHQGNAYAIIGRVRRALREAGVSDEEVKQLSDEATSGDYDPAADRSSMTRNPAGWRGPVVRGVCPSHHRGE